PDVVLMDLRMPRVDGVRATRAIRDALGDRVRVLVLTTFDDDASILRALEAGAVGYLLKDVSRERLLEAIANAARGEAPLSDRVGARLLEWVGKGAPVDPLSALGLSARERDVLESLSGGHSNKEIAAALGVSEGTVKNHLTRVFEKLGVEDRTQAALRARDLLG
ncbi:MAG: response regulator transcription factor, partial [Myxococcales bacterium]|nr:response regulator transcription factor [Myxococcales bacterium]